MRRLAGRAAGLIAVGVALASAATIPAVDAAAQTTSTTTPSVEGRVRLVAQTPWVGTGGQLDLTLAVTSDVPDSALEVAVAVHQAVTSRSGFQQSLESRALGPIVGGGFLSARLDELERGPGGVLFVRFGVQDPALPRDRNRLQLSRPGVYPVEVNLRGAGATRAVSRFATHLIYSPTPAESPLNVAWVVPVSATPSLQADGTTDRAGPARGPAAVARALQARPNVAVTIDPTPETILSLDRGGEDDQATLAGLRAIAGGTQTLAEPFVPVSAASLAALEGEMSRQLSRGDQVLRVLLGVKPDPRTRVLAPDTTEQRVADLAGQLVDRVVVPEKLLVASPRRITPTEPFRLAAGIEGGPTAVAGDAGLSDHFRRGTDGVLAAHHLLADLAVLFFDAPGSRQRGVVVLPPRDWVPTSAFLDATLAGLGASPVLRPVTLNTLFDRVPVPTDRGRPRTRTLAATETVSLPVGEIRRARTAAQALTSVTGPDNAMAVNLNDAVLVAEAADMRSRERRRRLDDVHERVASEAAKIKMVAARTVTLTARRGRIPITVNSATGYQAKVVVSLSSSKLLFPDGSSTTVELDRPNTTARFTVQARTSGSFPLRVRVTSPDGQLIIGETRLSVRSTAASGVGILLSAGAAAFLAVWWARHAFGRRRASRR